MVTDMMIGVVVNEAKDTGLSVAQRLTDAIYSRGGDAFIVTGAEFGATADGRGDTGISAATEHAAFDICDIIISIGGDGTLIKTARETLRYGAPILGVNLGSFGYLTEVETSQIDAVLDRIFNNDYYIEERMMLSITRESGDDDSRSRHPETVGGYTETALNELAVGRGDAPHVVRLKLYLNDTFLDLYSGDGVLISTPTGSTAYSLSAGGPVIDPGLDVISIVPVCSHVIFSRPVLVAPDKVITIIPAGAGDSFKASVSVDGFGVPALCAGEIIKVRRSEYTTKMLRFNTDNFYTALKNKLFETTNKLGLDANLREMSVYG